MRYLLLITFALSIGSASYGHVISAYSPYHQGKRIYLDIQDGIIKNISTSPITSSEEAPIVLDHYVLPGLIDLHNHVQYNVLPLWNKARGQYNNRFEWRKDPSYKAYVSSAMRVFQDNGRPNLRNNILWAELKSLSSGTTALLGSGGNAYHGKDFGPINLELLQEYIKTDIRIDLSTDIVSEQFYENIYLPYLKEQFESGHDYDTAYHHYLEQSGIANWYETFIANAQSIDGILRLIFGDHSAPLLDQEEVNEDNLEEYLDVLLNLKLSVKVWDKNRTKKDIKDFILGSRRNSSALSVEKTIEVAKQFFALDGNFLFHYTIRDFAYDYQNKRSTFLAAVHDEEHHHGLVVHLSEGKKDDEFTEREFSIAKQLGFIDKGLVIIHGMGLKLDELKLAAHKGISLVWSPYSNLLLYGQTHNMSEVFKSRINLTLGPDWAVTGSKNLLDEMTFAKRLLKLQGIKISNKQLVDMVTVNAAKALGIETIMGSIKKGSMANLIFVKKAGFTSGFDALIEGGQAAIDLVTVQGQAFYGSKQLLRKFPMPEGFKISGAPTKSSCTYRKFVAFTESFSLIAKQLNAKLKQYQGAEAPLSVDPIFSCADPDYAERTENFLKNEYLGSN